MLHCSRYCTQSLAAKRVIYELPAITSYAVIRYALWPLVQAMDFRLLIFCGCKLFFSPLSFSSSR